MKDNKSIFSAKDNTKVVEFGRGRICISYPVTQDEWELVWLGDAKKDREIGVAAPTDKDWTWEKDITGENVLLVFNKPESIDMLIESLKTAKEKLINRTNNNTSKGAKNDSKDND